MKDLKQFIHEASKNTYASGNSDIRKKEKDGSTTIVYENGDYKYHDNYFGGEPYGGREVVFHNGKPIWMMVYYGYMTEDSDQGEVTEVLLGALSNSTVDIPYRGPKEFVKGDYKYINELDGQVENFNGIEKIFKGNELVYTARYVGGMVDRR
jgi:hypothetical protein